MRWLWVIVGLMLLMSVWMINRFMQLRKPSHQRYARLKCSCRVLRLLRKAGKLRPASPETVAFESCKTQLAGHIRRVRKQLRKSPPLPLGDEEHPRVLSLAYDVSDAGDFSPSALLQAITDWDDFPLTSNEVLALPLAITIAQSQRLCSVLRIILSDNRERAKAQRLYRRFRAAAQPAHLLDKRSLSSTGLAALYDECAKEQDAQRTSTLETWLEQQGIPAEALQRIAREHQEQLIHELHRAREFFTSLERLDWPRHYETADPLHELLLKDPSGAYPRLDVHDRQHLRSQIETFSRHVRLPATDVARQALAQAHAAQGTTPDGCISWYFQERQGCLRLYRALHTGKGLLWVHMQHRRKPLSHFFLVAFGVIIGFAFLQDRQPVFMLPFVLLAAGNISRSLLRLLPRPSMPQLSLSHVSRDDMPILVALYVELQDPDAARHAVQRLHTASQAFPRDIHFLLLADFGPCITAISGVDHAIVHAASAAINELADARFHYLQRSRNWEATRHCYCTAGGSIGAMQDLCSWIARGDASTSVTFSTVDPSALERRYAYVFFLTGSTLPIPGTLEHLLGTMIHPLHQRIQTLKGWRGYSALSPEGMGFSDGAVLLEPDAFLESTAGMSVPATYAGPLYAEQAGHASVPGIRMNPPPITSTWTACYQRAQYAWLLARWQLPQVQTPSGLIVNPLRPGSRFRLREHLRSTLAPLGCFLLLLWAVLCTNRPLLLLALLSILLQPERQHEKPLTDVFRRLCLLPASMTINLLAIFDLLFRKHYKTRDFPAIEAWGQILAATVFIAISFALPGGSLSGLAIGVLFACFPLAHGK